jgi:HEAT repeat protein
MIDEPSGAWRFAVALVQVGLVFVFVATGAVLFGRTAYAIGQYHQRRFRRRYGALVDRALGGDDAAVNALVASPHRHRIGLALLLILPLIEDRDATRIERTQVIARALSLVAVADRLLRSVWWWRRALALRALGLTQVRERTGRIIAALDDGHPDVRAAALDALTDLKDPASLHAIVIRLHDPSLQRGRRAAALTAFGHQCEPFLLELADIDPTRRSSYARALAVCGSEMSRPALCAWTNDGNPLVRAAAFEALAHVGLDDGAARQALEALDEEEPVVRTAAAHALRGWRGAGDPVLRLVRHLDDVWTVAVAAAETLRTIRPEGLEALRAVGVRTDLPGILARQMLWEEERAVC